MERKEKGDDRSSGSKYIPASSLEALYELLHLPYLHVLIIRVVTHTWFFPLMAQEQEQEGKEEGRGWKRQTDRYASHWGRH